MADAAELVERNLILLGATGIEDKLQDVSLHDDDRPETVRFVFLQQVPESLSMLLKAGIKVKLDEAKEERYSHENL